MFRCDFCGFSSESPKARFCANCGPNGPATKWKADQVNEEANISRFSNLYGSVFTNAPKDSKNQILELRRKLKISFDVWKEIEAHYATYSTSTDRDWPISLRYGFAEKEAFAGQDALIEFEVENLTDKHFFKVDIEWDDPGTFRVDLKAISDQYVPPSSTTNVSASVVFDRSGPKQIKGTTISIVDEAGEKRVYAVEAIRISIQNPSLSIQNTVNNTNSISIQGRGVVDAQGLGGQKSAEVTSGQQNEITWTALALSPLIDHEELARAITSRLKQDKEKIDKSDTIATDDGSLLNAQSLTDETLGKEDQDSAMQLNALQAVSLRMAQNDHFTTSLVLNVPASTALQDASLEMHVERGDKVTSKTLALTLMVGEHRREFLCLEDGIAVFTSQFVQFNGDTDVEFEFLTILRADPDETSLECVEADGLIYIRERPHNVPVELSELVDAITEPNDFLQIGSARAPDFDWEFPLVLSEKNQLVGTISPLIGSNEQLDAVGDFAGPWEQSQAFATIAAATPSIEEDDESNPPEEAGTGDTTGSALEIAVETKSRSSKKGTIIFVITIIVGVAITAIYESGQNTQPQITDVEFSQLIEDASIPNLEERALAVKSARENSNLPSCPVDGWKDGCFGSWRSSDGDRYVGEFFNDKRHGWGVYLWADGQFHVGNWIAGRRSGIGTRYYEEGTWEECEWVPDYSNMKAYCK